MNMENILIVGAHFDDAELGAGGTAARLSAEGKRVYKLTLTDNVTKTDLLGLDIDFDSSLRCSTKACSILGITQIDFAPYVPDCELNYDTNLMQRIEKIIFEKHVDTVFIHARDDANQDHRAAFQLCRTAARHCRNVFCYQSNFYVLSEPYYPNYFVDISAYAGKKREALAQYGAQHDRFGKLFDMALKRNEIWGFSNKVDYAEGFAVIKACI